MTWSQNYDPLHGPLSTLAAGIPIVILLGLLAVRRVPAYAAALTGLGAALAVAIGIVGMPAPMAGRAALLGAAYGILPIGWIVLNVMFLYELTSKRGVFVALQRAITSITSDRRLQLLLIAFCFGAFFEGAAGFGTPVAVTGAILIGLGFPPFEASVFSLIANTAPVAFGALGTPIIALQGVSGLDLGHLSAMVGRQLPFFSLILPFWLIVAYAGWRSVRELWAPLAITGISFAVPQYLMSNFHGPWLVDIVAAACSMLCLAVFLKFWHHGEEWNGAAVVLSAAKDPRPDGGLLRPEGDPSVASLPQDDRVARVPQDDKHSLGALEDTDSSVVTATRREVTTALHPATAQATSLRDAVMPWVILTVIVFAWGTPQIKNFLNSISAPNIVVPGLDHVIFRVPPVLSTPTPETAVFAFNWLSASGTAILLTAIISGFVLRYSIIEMIRAYGRTLILVWRSLLTICAMLALGYVTRYSGEDAILGLAFAHTGVFYPFFAAMLGWLGVALTGSDTSSNVLFGSLQNITAHRLGLDPVLMTAANSSGGVMGKMIDAQSIVVASTATEYVGNEWKILRFVFWHSIGLATLVGILVMLQQYVFTSLIVR